MKPAMPLMKPPPISMPIRPAPSRPPMRPPIRPPPNMPREGWAAPAMPGVAGLPGWAVLRCIGAAVPGAVLVAGGAV